MEKNVSDKYLSIPSITLSKIGQRSYDLAKGIKPD